MFDAILFKIISFNDQETNLFLISIWTLSFPSYLIQQRIQIEIFKTNIILVIIRVQLASFFFATVEIEDDEHLLKIQHLNYFIIKFITFFVCLFVDGLHVFKDPRQNHQ